jgi:hypothetical protein
MKERAALNELQHRIAFNTFFKDERPKPIKLGDSSWRGKLKKLLRQDTPRHPQEGGDFCV